jgi:hypothetical protein
MRKRNYLPLAIAGILLVAGWGVALAEDVLGPEGNANGGPAGIFSSEWDASGSSESIGTGTMPDAENLDVEKGESAVTPAEPAIDPGSEPALESHDSLGTGSMIDSAGKPIEQDLSAPGVDGQGGLTRPDVDYP